ncbi:MAG: hypothetical protein BAJATHORv1_20429 [Candidatus Thorarchaeota archaeon]|nr:MAG: hypothetical protein BAJATHORv1_20429 [Candidatus Thorarchaeota archaeon]
MIPSKETKIDTIFIQSKKDYMILPMDTKAKLWNNTCITV